MACSKHSTPDQDCFVHRMAALPLVSFSAQKALSTYEKTKNFNNMAHTACTLLEHSLFFAIGKAQPFYNHFQTPLEGASKAACRGLSKLETSVPGIKMSPEELKEVGMGYYKGSMANRGIDVLFSAKDYGVQKAGETRSVCVRGVTVAMEGCEMVTGVIRHPLISLNNTLDVADAFIDKYIAENNPDKSVPNGVAKDQEVRLGMKLRVMGGKMGGGMRRKTDRTLHTLSSLYSFNFSKDPSTLLNSVAHSLSALTAHAQADRVLLSWVKFSSRVGSEMTSYTVLSLTPLLPQGTQSSLNTFNHSIQDLSTHLAQAESLGAVSEELKQTISHVTPYVSSSFDFLSQRPPLNWIMQTKGSEMNGNLDNTQLDSTLNGSLDSSEEY